MLVQTTQGRGSGQHRDVTFAYVKRDISFHVVGCHGDTGLVDCILIARAKAREQVEPNKLTRPKDATASLEMTAVL